MTVHQLKIHQQPFSDLESGAKNSEVRDCSDRDFKVGDEVTLMLVDEQGMWTSKSLLRTITHVQTGYGLPESLCVLSYASSADHLRQRIAFLTGEIHTIANERDQLKARCAEMKPDYDRYSWVRSQGTKWSDLSSTLFERVNDEHNPPYMALKFGAELDSSIDASISRTKENVDDQ